MPVGRRCRRTAGAFVGKYGHADLPAEATDRDHVETSLGKLDSDAFWQRMGVDPIVEDTYLAGHRLVDATHEALPRLKQRYGRLACLSNDVSRWSAKLRQRFDLESWIDDWFISGDRVARKPSAEIYRMVSERLGVAPQEVVFVDDRPRNLDAAKAAGFRTVLLDIRSGPADHPHRHIRRLVELP